jgi:hypothetical protein
MAEALLFYQAQGHAPGIISFADTCAVQVSMLPMCLHVPPSIALPARNCLKSLRKPSVMSTLSGHESQTLSK